MEMAGIDQDEVGFRHAGSPGVVARLKLYAGAVTRHGFLRRVGRGTISERRLLEGEDAMPEITITPLTESIGAEIGGVDLSKPVDAATREALSQALAEHLALVFHDQKLTPDQYLAAAEAFGPPMRQHYSQHHMPGYPEIGLVGPRTGQAPAERWHTDHTNRERPPAATMLYGVEIPSAGGGTSVANMRAAYAALPEAERHHLETLRTVNSLDEDKTDTRPEDWEKYSKPIVHPMVRTHPVHGLRAVFFHITKTLNIEGMSQEAS